LNTIGIDPGRTGGVCILNDVGEVTTLCPMPLTTEDEIDGKKLKDIFINHQPCVIYCEKVAAMPGNGVCSMFSFGKGFGIILGVSAALELNLKLVYPRTWQNHFHDIKTWGLDPKSRALESVKKIFPHQSFLATKRSHKPHDGIVDACLIAKYGYDNFRPYPDDTSAGGGSHGESLIK
jgi:hypothetical protein